MTRARPPDRRHELFERATDLLCVVGDDGHLLRTNPRWETVLGLPTREILAVSFLTWLHPEDRAAGRAAADRLRAGEDPVGLVARFQTSTADYRWWSWTASPLADGEGFVAVGRDVTEARRELDTFRLAIEAAPTGILVVDESGIIVLVNRHLEGLFGYSRQELVGRSIATLLPVAVHGNHQTWVARYFTSPVTRPMGAGRELFGVCKDGSQVPLEIGLNPMVTSEGRYVLASIVDISARRRHEVEMQGHLAELERHRREMTALSELSALLQHAEAMGEPQRLVMAYAERLFPAVGIGVYLYASSARDLELTASCGTFVGAERIVPADCWALRRGQAHRSVRHQEPGCLHAEAGTGLQLCVPLAAHGQSLGVLTFCLHSGMSPVEPVEALARAVADQLALAISHLELRERLRRLSIRDPLTDLYNRRYLEESAEHELARARRNGSGVGLLMIDIDNFKRFNDEHGHPAADLALQELARALTSECRGEDVVCRYGGEEFVVLVPGADAAAACALAERIRSSVEAELRRITLSVGVACFPGSGSRWELLIAHADAMVYEAKRQGRNRVVGP